MENIDYNKEIELYGEELNSFSEDEKYHCYEMSDVELMNPSEERTYYINLKDNDGKFLKRIYVDRHDYILYMRPIWSQWQKDQREKRCLISNGKGGYKHCTGKCSECDKSKNGKPTSLDSIYEKTKIEPTAEGSDPSELTLIEEANKLLWDLIRRVSTEEQYAKVRYYFKDHLSFQKVGDIYGVSHKAVEKTVKSIIKKVAMSATEDEKEFLFKYIFK